MTPKEPDMRERCENCLRKDKVIDYAVEKEKEYKKEIEELKKNNVLGPWKIIDGLKKDRETAKNNWISCKEKLKVVEAERDMLLENNGFLLDEQERMEKDVASGECFSLFKDKILEQDDKIKYLTSQLKIAREALEAISKHQKLSAGDMAGLSTTFVIANNALQKISEVVDAWNNHELAHEAVNASKQTQEPERKEPDEVIYCDECGSKLPVDETWKQNRDEQAMHTALKPKSNKRGGSPCSVNPEKEPECDWCGYLGMVKQGEQCQKCRKPLEKPAKKECEHDFEEWILTQDGMYYRECSKCYKEELKQSSDNRHTISDNRKDELAERLRTKAVLNTPYGLGWLSDEASKNCADEARKWACEVAENWRNNIDRETLTISTDELLKRLRGDE